jgi:hypothetical protein
MADVNDFLQQGIAALKAGQKAEARNLLSQAVRQDPKNEAAWMWLSGAVEGDQERRYCMEKVLKLNPHNALAQQALEQMQAPEATASAPAEAAPPPATSAPAEPTPPPTVRPPAAPVEQAPPPAISTPPPQAQAGAELPPLPIKTPRRRKSNPWLIAIGVGMLICVACVVGGYFALQQTAKSAFVTDPVEAGRIGREMVDYTTPPGYTEMAMSILTVKAVIIAPKTQSSTGMIFMLMQVPSGNTNQQDLERQMRQAMEQQSSNQQVQTIVVGTQRVNIKGKPVTFTISEGTSNGRTVRQMLGAFPGKKGMVMLMISGVTTAWDQKVIDRFLASIR